MVQYSAVGGGGAHHLSHDAVGLETPKTPVVIGSSIYFSGAGGLTSTARDYAQFAVMLCGR